MQFASKRYIFTLSAQYLINCEFVDLIGLMGPGVCGVSLGGGAGWEAGIGGG